MLIVVLVSICLISFSGIAYSTARHSYEQSISMVERTKNYYGACNEAEIMLSGLSEAPQSETTYSYPFGTAMDELIVTIAPDDSEKGYKIIEWVIADTASWEAPSEGADGAMMGPMGPSAPEGGPAAPEGGPAAPVGGPVAPQ